LVASHDLHVALGDDYLGGTVAYGGIKTWRPQVGDGFLVAGQARADGGDVGPE
jgi:hypothetical protein